MNKTVENIKKYIPKNAKTELYGNIVAFEVSASEIVKIADDLFNIQHLSLKMITATDNRKDENCFKVWYIFGAPEEHAFVVPFIQLKDTKKFPTICNVVHGAWNYEKKIQTFFGLTSVGHPDPRPTILHENWPTNMHPLKKDFEWNTRPAEAKGVYQFQKVGGEGIYEIPVGPIHAGIIEPGHFRFSVAGEEIISLEPRLGFTHKGSEKLFETLSLNDKIRLSEKISGDSSFSHSLAFCQTLEQLSDAILPKRAAYLRVIYAELERLANHFGDIGAIMTDTGFNFGGAHGARLREMIMQINERLTESRFLRGMNKIGGVSKDIDTKEKKKLSNDLAKILKDFSEVMEIAENSDSLMNRLKGTGKLSREIALNHGATGIAAKAVGIKNDSRIDFPYAAYNKLNLDGVEIEQDGDVYARFYVRVKEVFASIKLIEQTLQTLPDGPISTPKVDVFKKNSIAISTVEGWRGEIFYLTATDSNGNISRVAPRDPSSINWTLPEHVVAHNVVPDFPLINKSFNLSYTGNDL